MARDPEVTKVLRRFTTAKREIKKAVEIAGKLGDDHNDLRPGHVVEAKRLIEEIRIEVEKAIAILEERRNGT